MQFYQKVPLTAYYLFTKHNTIFDFEETLFRGILIPITDIRLSGNQKQNIVDTVV